MIQAFVFYMFAAVAILSGVMVISARNPVHSVLFLILAFFNAAGLLLLQGAEFIAMVLVVVYVGAVAVLFLFVVMMLDIDTQKMRQGFVRYLPMGGLVGAALLAELLMVVAAWRARPGLLAGLPETTRTPDLTETQNIEALGNLLYTHYVYLFQGGGLILLVAMVGAIVLTLRRREGVRRQKIVKQTTRTVKEAVEIVKVRSGEGI